MKRRVLLLLALSVLILEGVVIFDLYRGEKGVISPVGTSLKSDSSTKESKYAPYSFEALSQRQFTAGKINLGTITKKEKNFNTYVFTYQSGGKTISGMANIPNGTGKFPVIILLRGYADRKYYHIGLGTERSANNLAENGFLTLAPDFLGYGYSDWEDTDILLARFYRPVEVLDLISSLGSLSSVDTNHIGFWGHSNGGQIALSILEITGKPYPTSLWAPVSLGFPEGVLTYLGTEEEVGNVVREKIEEFKKDNDPKKYSISEYFTKIKAPFIVHQATADELIKTQWTKDLVKKLQDQGNEVSLFFYSENHNFNRYEATGEILRQRDLEFFKKWLK